MKLTTHQAMYLCLLAIPYFGYCITYGLPTTLEQAMFAALYSGIIAIFVMFVFALSLLVFGLPVPQLFKFKK
ncbi:MAG: hypothetical protein Q8Q60_00605 [Candidatus Chromulinivorax sp.]|nr:hypothetical protein [Candidatus Chromulinivorax sp.]